MHIYLGFHSEGLKELPIHTIWLDDWKRGINAERYVVVLSIPTVLDLTMSQPNRHVVHGYTAANELWDFWKV